MAIVDEKIISFKKGKLITPEQAMQLAIRVAELGAPFVSPNPLVGCVIVDRNHQFLASGFHSRFGGDHAEVAALKQVNADELKNSTLYVTLEPCAHEGKTPSCAKTIAKLPIKKVVFGLTDPNPVVSGQGAEIIRSAGKTVVEYAGPLKNNLEDVCEIFLKNYREKKIFVAAKVASSLDGQIALKSGESKWITSEASRVFVHELRSRYDSVLVGRLTVEKDNPSLNIRHPEIQKGIKLIILDPANSILDQVLNKKDFKFLGAHKNENIFFATKNPLIKSAYAQIQFTNLLDLNQKLWELGIRSTFIEGGAMTYSSFLQAGLIDRLHLFLAPVLIGSKGGIAWTNGFEIESLEKKLQLKNVRTKSISPDIYLTGRL